MGTARDLIKGSLRLLGVIASGETPTAAEQADALSSLNSMIESWSNDGFLIFEEKREEFTLSISTQDYSIGSGATFDTVRPQTIMNAGAKESATDVEVPIRVFNQDEWARIAVKGARSTLPLGIYYNPTYPNGTISVWPIPTLASKLVLYSLKPLTGFPTIDTTVTLPPGYERMLRYNLAVEIAPEYGRPVSPEIAAIASESMALIKRANTKPVYAISDVDGITGRKTFNWLTGE